MPDQDTKKLIGSQKEVYLDTLISALKGLQGRLTELGREDVSEFCGEITDTIGFFRYRRTKEKFGIPDYASLEIDPTLSGFATAEQMRDLYARQRLVSEYLGRLPSRKEIVKQATEQLMRGSIPEPQIESLVCLNYYERLKGARLIFNPELTTTQTSERVKGVSSVQDKAKGKFDDKYTITKRTHENGIIAYEIKARGFNIFDNIFAYLTLVVEAEKNECDLGAESTTMKLVRNDCMRWNSRGAFLTLDSNSLVVPISVERWVIGPYYCKETVNVSALDEVFNPYENPFLLRFRREWTEAEKFVEIERRRGTTAKRAIAAPETVDEYALCPYALQREFERFFEGEPRKFTIYGI